MKAFGNIHMGNLGYSEYGLLHWAQEIAGSVFVLLAVAAWVVTAKSWARRRRG